MMIRREIVGHGIAPRLVVTSFTVVVVVAPRLPGGPNPDNDSEVSKLIPLRVHVEKKEKGEYPASPTLSSLGVICVQISVCVGVWSIKYMM